MQKNRHFKTIGVLGGMGPAATALAFDLIIKMTPAQKDKEHLPVLIYNLPQIPDRTAAILGLGPSPVPAVVAGLHVLKNAAADFAIIPCNTVFYFYRQFSQQVDLPIIHIGMPVIKRLNEMTELANRKIGVLCTTGTRTAKIYDTLLHSFDYEPVFPSEEAQESLMRAIYRIKSGDEYCSQPILQAGINLVNQGASQVILGCTELSLIYDALLEKLLVIDTTRCLSQAAIDIALGKISVRDFIL